LARFLDESKAGKNVTVRVDCLDGSIDFAVKEVYF
jgi:hypothetical protein